METTLMLGDFIWIALIVIVFGGGSAYATKGKDDTKKLNSILEKIEKLESSNKNKDSS